jgi:hypothetical protein
MVRHGVAGGCALALVFASAAGAGHGQRTITLRIVAAPRSLGPTRDCPGGQVQSRLVTRGGRIAGTALDCVLGATITHPPNALVGKVTEQVVETDAIPGGQITSRQRQVFRFNAAGTRARASFRGKVTGGTGSYAGARGMILGGGPMGVANVSPPDLVLTIRLR